MGLIGGYDVNTETNQLALSSVTVTKAGTKTILDVQSNNEPSNNVAIDPASDGQPTYQGWAVPGTASGAGVYSWKICKQFYNGSSIMTSRLWASGNTVMDKDWEDRATYPYS